MTRRVRGFVKPRAETLSGREMQRCLEAGDGLNLPSATERWRRLLKERSPAVRLAAEKFLFEALHGKSKPWEEPPAGPIRITVDVCRSRTAIQTPARLRLGMIAVEIRIR
jgi:hypothetical protein